MTKREIEPNAVIDPECLARFKRFRSIRKQAIERAKSGRLDAIYFDSLNRSFSTLLEGKNISRAINVIGEVLNYANTTVREMEIFDVTSQFTCWDRQNSSIRAQWPYKPVLLNFKRRRKPREELKLLLEPLDQQGVNSILKGLSFVLEPLKRRENYRTFPIQLIIRHMRATSSMMLS